MANSCSSAPLQVVSPADMKGAIVLNVGLRTYSYRAHICSDHHVLKYRTVFSYVNLSVYQGSGGDKNTLPQ